MFCNNFNTDVLDLQQQDVLTFIEFLANRKLSVCTITSYMSAIKAIAFQVNINTAVFTSKKLSLMLKSCSTLFT